MSFTFYLIVKDGYLKYTREGVQVKASANIIIRTSNGYNSLSPNGGVRVNARLSNEYNSLSLKGPLNKGGLNKGIGKTLNGGYKGNFKQLA